MMRLSNFSKLAQSAKAALTSRDAASTQQNLETINAAVQKLTATVDGYQGGLLAANSISNDEAALGQKIKDAIKDANASEMVTEEEARGIIKYITDTLEPNIKTCMTSLQTKKEQLKSAGLQGTVSGDMEDLRKLTNDLSTALLAKSPEATREDGKKAMQLVDGDFEVAIKAFV
ncbi:hypothetical protein M409DRAFT_67786 [Zasmidium cellare ATCC 36951]|uniref:Uncharacterized protein n=1 Tax=Zasmidium cellare ATCC 36951 TaxID=1080233 RepID=A0A6A6CD61_ZASCE|nr:uncharacterized protein M409DRAFT_67786 [Zasmidium cellare ATCC 36951]KAF2164673.1 hypothetical protein M409DRAFT_67786 [Zasmidium cellare ATCC 36951]